jgi:hypothetical protein
MHMPFFFYSQISPTVSKTKEQYKTKLLTACREQNLSNDDMIKVHALIASMDELYHMFNQDPESLIFRCGVTQNLNMLYRYAAAKIKPDGRNTAEASQTIQKHLVPQEVPKQINTLQNSLDDYKEKGLTTSRVMSGAMTAISLMGVLLFAPALPLFILSGTATIALTISATLLTAAALWMLTTFGELSYHEYRLANDKQMNDINAFFAMTPAPAVVNQEQIENFATLSLFT